MARTITPFDIKTMNEAYLRLKTYAAVARETGFSPATVKKYVQADYEIVDESTFVRFDRPLPEFDTSLFEIEDWCSLCLLSDDEKRDVRKLWKELEV